MTLIKCRLPKKAEVKHSRSSSSFSLSPLPSIWSVPPLHSPPDSPTTHRRARKERPMQPNEEDNARPAVPPSCPAWCISHNTDAPDKADDHLHEATPALMPCIALERTTNETGTIHHPPSPHRHRTHPSALPIPTRQRHLALHRRPPPRPRHHPRECPEASECAGAVCGR